MGVRGLVERLNSTNHFYRDCWLIPVSDPISELFCDIGSISFCAWSLQSSLKQKYKYKLGICISVFVMQKYIKLLIFIKKKERPFYNFIEQFRDKSYVIIIQIWGELFTNIYLIHKFIREGSEKIHICSRYLSFYLSI